MKQIIKITTLAEYNEVTARVAELETMNLSDGDFNPLRSELSHGRVLLKQFEKNKGCVRSLQIDSLFIASHITYTIMARGEQMRDKWKCDAWLIDFSGPKRGDKFVNPSFDYYTGTAHRVNRLPLTDKTPYGRRQYELSAVAVKPKIAGLMYSLIVDDVSGLSFMDWCSEYGYDYDSRKALAVYHTCEEQTAKMRAFFPADVMVQLRVILEGY